MKVETLEYQLEYLEGGIELIKNELKKCRVRLLTGHITRENIKQYKKVRTDYKFTKFAIKTLKQRAIEK